MKRSLVSFACGLVFAIGLGLSGMTLPAKVLGFLDLTGAWDPSLALVMGSALAVLFLARRLAPPRPLLAPAFASPVSRGIDGRLVVGASLFGIGWGLGGFCPGPGLVALGAGSKAAAVFVVAMSVGMLLFHLFERSRSGPEARAAGGDGAVVLPPESCG